MLSEKLRTAGWLQISRTMIDQHGELLPMFIMKEGEDMIFIDSCESIRGFWLSIAELCKSLDSFYGMRIIWAYSHPAGKTIERLCHYV